MENSPKSPVFKEDFAQDSRSVCRNRQNIRSSFLRSQPTLQTVDRDVQTELEYLSVLNFALGERRPYLKLSTVSRTMLRQHSSDVAILVSIA